MQCYTLRSASARGEALVRAPAMTMQPSSPGLIKPHHAWSSPCAQQRSHSGRMIRK